VLYRYRARRLSDITMRVRGIDGLNKLVTTNLFGASFVRHLGLKGLDRIPALKHFAMDYGLSPTMDSGPLLQGKPL
jgi:2-polyprenyl-6-methoxyphenol hydroxylase-like FAD-dependent oxidoreductase